MSNRLCRHRATALDGSNAIRSLGRDTSGAALLEFALVAPAFISLLTGIFYVSMAFLTQQGLETAAQGAGRLFQTGAAQTSTVGSNKGMSAADFKNAICNGASVTNASGSAVTIAQMLPPFMSCSSLTTNVVVQPANTAFTSTILSTPTYNCYGTVCNSASNATAATTATSSGIAGSQNRIVVVQLFYSWTTFASVFGIKGVSFTSQSGTQAMTATAVVTAEAYSCSASQTSC